MRSPLSGRGVPALALMLVALGAAAPAGVNQTAAPGGASVSGRVSTPGGGQADGISVVVFPSDARQWAGPAAARAVRRTPVTDGRYEISGLPAGSFHLAFVVTSGLEKWPDPLLLDTIANTRPMPVALAPGEAVVVNAVVSVTASGLTVDSAQLTRTAIERVPSGGMPAGLPGVPPAGRRGGPPPSTAPGAISGRVTDAEGRPVAGASVASVRPTTVGTALTLVRYGQPAVTDELGRYRLANRAAGSYLVVVEPYAIDLRSPAAGSRRQVPASVIDTDGVRRGYVTTLHGGTDDSRLARRIDVATTEVPDVDIQLLRRPVYDVAGRIEPMPATAIWPAVTVAAVVGTDRARPDARRVPIAPDGRFTVPDLPDGEYTLSFATLPGGWSEARVRVSGRTPDPVVMPLRPSVRVSGRVEFLGNPTIAPAPAGQPQWGVELVPVPLQPGSGMMRVPFAGTGTFSVHGTGAGPLRLRATAPPPWIQIEGSIGGVDTLDLPLAVSADVDNARVVFADRVTSLLITVRDGAGEPVAGTGVLVFGEDERYWSGLSRRVQAGRTTASGAVTLTQFPPGRYLVIETGEVWAADRVSVESIRRLRDRALPFDLAVGENRPILLRR